MVQRKERVSARRFSTDANGIATFFGRLSNVVKAGAGGFVRQRGVCIREVRVDRLWYRARNVALEERRQEAGDVGSMV